MSLLLLLACADEPNCNLRPRSCREDADCISIPADTCGCQAGGTNQAVNAACEAEETPESRGLFPCAQISTCHRHEPECRFGRCELVSVDTGRSPL